MTNNPVDWFEVYVSDMVRAKAFYEAVLGVKCQKLETPNNSNAEMWAFPMERAASGAAGALVKMEGGPSGGNSTIVYFASEDCAIEVKRVPPNGGKIMKDKLYPRLSYGEP